MSTNAPPPATPPSRFNLSHLLVAVISALLAIGVTIAVTDEPGPTPTAKHKRTVTVTLGGPGHKTVTLPPAAQTIVAEQQAEDAKGNDTGAESDLHENALPAPAAVAHAKSIIPAGQPVIPKHVTDAAPSVPGCTTSLVRNYSSRRGAPVLLGVIHWTGSAPTRGPAGGLAIVHWFDTPAASASSDEITDQAGRCWLVVPETQKAWTQAGFNPWSVSVEIVNQGVQPLFQTAAARRVVVRLMQGWHKRWKLPYRRARVAGCAVIRSGFLAHRDLGQCGGGHPDVGNFNLDGLIREAAAGDRPPSATDRSTCRKLNIYRRDVRRHVKVSAHRTKINVARRKVLEHRHITCTTRGPVRS